MCYQASLCSAHAELLFVQVLPCHEVSTMSLDQFTDSRRGEENNNYKRPSRLKPATVLILLIRCQKRSVTFNHIIPLFFNDEVTLQLYK